MRENVEYLSVERQGFSFGKNLEAQWQLYKFTDHKNIYSNPMDEQWLAPMSFRVAAYWLNNSVKFPGGRYFVSFFESSHWMSCSATLWPGFCNHVISSVSSTSLSRSKSESSAAAALPLRMNLNWFQEPLPRNWSREHRLNESTESHKPKALNCIFQQGPVG